MSMYDFDNPEERAMFERMRSMTRKKPVDRRERFDMVTPNGRPAPARIEGTLKCRLP